MRANALIERGYRKFGVILAFDVAGAARCCCVCVCILCAPLSAPAHRQRRSSGPSLGWAGSGRLRGAEERVWMRPFPHSLRRGRFSAHDPGQNWPGSLRPAAAFFPPHPSLPVQQRTSPLRLSPGSHPPLQ